MLHQILKRTSRGSKMNIQIIPAEKYQDLTGTTTIVKGKNNKIIVDLDRTAFRGTHILEFTGDNNELNLAYDSVFRQCSFKFTGSNSNIVFAPSCWISIGAHVCGNHCQISVGQKTTMERVLAVCQEDGTRITIGEDCMFSSDVFLRTSDSHSIIDLSSQKRINRPQDVTINNHVWVGQSAKINKGVTLNDDAIIANAAVVTTDVPSHTVFGGNPARQIKDGVTWSRELLPFD